MRSAEPETSEVPSRLGEGFAMLVAVAFTVDVPVTSAVEASTTVFTSGIAVIPDIFPDATARRLLEPVTAVVPMLSADTIFATPTAVELEVEVPVAETTGLATPTAVELEVEVPVELETGLATPVAVELEVAVPVDVTIGLATPAASEDEVAVPVAVESTLATPTAVDEEVAIPVELTAGLKIRMAEPVTDAVPVTLPSSTKTSTSWEKGSSAKALGVNT